MNPFDLARTLGYGPNDVMQFLQRAHPSIASAMTTATAAGYTADQVYQFLAKAMSGAKVDKRVSARVFGNQPINEATIMRSVQNVPPTKSFGAAPVLGGLAGAAVGGLVGGPVGAAIGATTGYSQLNKLSKAYEKHVQSGGTIPFNSFLYELAKGTALAGLSAAGINSLRQLAAAYLNNVQGDPNAKTDASPDQPPGGPEQTPPITDATAAQTSGTAPTQPMPGTPPQTIPNGNAAPVEQSAMGTGGINPSGGEQSMLDYLHQHGMGPIVVQLAGKVTPKEGVKALSNLFGSKPLFAIAKDLGLPITDVISRAFAEVQAMPASQQQANQPTTQEAQPTPPTAIQTEQPIPADESAPTITARPAETGALSSIFKTIMSAPPDKATLVRGIKPLANSLKSSNVVGAFYDTESNKMRSLFGNGEIYEYDNVPPEEFQNVTGGNARPVTEGQNQLGFWFQGKNPSIGAAFHQYIKKKSEDYPYRKLEKGEYTPSQNQLRESTRTFAASALFEPFRTVQRRGMRTEKGKVLREMEPALKGLDDEFMHDVVEYLEEKLLSTLKHPPTISRLRKEYTAEFGDAPPTKPPSKKTPRKPAGKT